MESKLMSLKVDFAFKEIMYNENVRKGFISAVLKIPVKEIISTTILNSYLRQEHQEDKLGILDVKVELNGNIEIDIEMQVVPFKYWAERTLFYNSKMYVETIESGKKYSTLKKVVSISILNFILLEENTFYNSFHIRNDITYTMFTDKMEWHIIELPKLPNNITTTNDLLTLWAGFINASGEDEELIKMLATKNEYISEAYEELEKISSNKQKRIEYEARQKAIYDHNSLMEDAKDRGIEKGIEIGEEKGKKKGIEIGKEEGKYEKAIETAKNLLAFGLKVDMVAQSTGLTTEQVKALII